jgi:hypothetical protein
MLVALQSAIAKGHPRSIEVAMRVLDQEADLNGLHAATKRELTGQVGGPLTMDMARQIIDAIDDEEEK